MSDREWMLPAALMTAGLCAFVAVLAPDHANFAGAFWLMLPCTSAAVAMVGVASLPLLFGMMRRGVDRPISRIIAHVRLEWASLLTAVAGILLAGMNMVAFMWAKPLLNYLIDFRADPFLAWFDQLLFLGIQPWELTGGTQSLGVAIFYHRAWFAVMILCLLLTFSMRPSREKSALILSYFALWTFVGPIGHAIAPAGGPIFYERLGYGPLFAGLKVPEETAKVADYLWRNYQAAGFGPGAGISAMPSLHVAMCAWMALVASQRLERVLRWAIYTVLLVIAALSVVLGWHYVSDGAIGAALAVLTYRLMLWLLARREDSVAAIASKTNARAVKTRASA